MQHVAREITGLSLPARPRADDPPRCLVSLRKQRSESVARVERRLRSKSRLERVVRKGAVLGVCQSPCSLSTQIRKGR